MPPDRPEKPQGHLPENLPENLSVPPHDLLAQLRDIMAGDETASAKLDRVMKMIAAGLGADVCSCYVMRSGNMLQLLSSTLSLKSDVPTRRVRVGEERVGRVAATAQPLVDEDRERVYQAFCGVPMLRNGQVRGVLVIRNRLPRVYGADVVDVLQTVSMVLAEMMTAGGIMPPIGVQTAKSMARRAAAQVEAVSLGRGHGMGMAVIYDPVVTVRDVVSDDTAVQSARLDRALADMRAAVAGMLARNAELRGTESYAILEAYQMLAQDESWIARIRAALANGLVAEAAVQQVQNETRARMGRLTDGYIRERLADLEDVSHRLMTHLIDHKTAPPAEGDIVLVARTLGPAVLMDYDRDRLKGIIVEQGGRSNHVSIVARSLGIPIVGQVDGICEMVQPGDNLVVDGDNGAIYINPTDYVLSLYARDDTADAQSRTPRGLFRETSSRNRSVTRDGRAVSVMVNAGMVAEVEGVFSSGADGIGLYRTELSFMRLRRYPSVSRQADIYESVLDRSGGKPVTFRTLDIGGDKPLPYFRPPAREDNPALGWRAMRIAVDRPVVLRSQFRALLQAARGRRFGIMLPFVSEVSEIDHAWQMWQDEVARARARGLPVAPHIPFGVMVEVPALVWHLDAVLDTVDFVSVGTNDLMQYLYAADRSHHAIRNRYDSLSPAMIRVLRDIARQCRQAGKPAGVCGEMAAQPLEAMVLLALGYDSLSMQANAVKAVREMVPALDAGHLLSYLESCMGSHAHSLRQQVLEYAQTHGIHIAETV